MNTRATASRESAADAAALRIGDSAYWDYAGTATVGAVVRIDHADDCADNDVIHFRGVIVGDSPETSYRQNFWCMRRFLAEDGVILIGRRSL